MPWRWSSTNDRVEAGAVVLFTDLVVLGASPLLHPGAAHCVSLVTVTAPSLLIDWMQGLSHDEKSMAMTPQKEIE